MHPDMLRALANGMHEDPLRAAASWRRSRRAPSASRSRQLIVLGTAQGATFLLIFRYVFGGAIGLGGLRYVDFLVPGYVTTAALSAGMGTPTAAETLLGNPAGFSISHALLWAAAIVAVCAPLAVAGYRRG